MEFEESKVSKPTIKKCPYCGELLPPLSKVCPSCGQIVEDSGGDDVTTMMSEIDTVCAKFANSSIRIYDYILLLIPIVYLIWVIVVIMKIIKSNKLYNAFISLSSKARTLYGANHKFHSYLNSKTTEVEEQKRKNKVSHIIIYVLIFIDILLLCISLNS
ncbi:MAG: zinc ribbon domain-containing protein [Prevotella sp.]|nr:zinc ribbon domain-containing protein [Prevotella sp.]